MSGLRKLCRRVIGSVNVPHSCGAINGSVTRRHLRPQRAICISISSSARQKSFRNSRRQEANCWVFFFVFWGDFRCMCRSGSSLKKEKKNNPLAISARLSYCCRVLILSSSVELRLRDGGHSELLSRRSVVDSTLRGTCQNSPRQEERLRSQVFSG